MTDHSLLMSLMGHVWCSRCKRMMPAVGEHRFLASASLCVEQTQPLDLSFLEAKGEWPTLDKAQEKHDTAD